MVQPPPRDPRPLGTFWEGRPPPRAMGFKQNVCTSLSWQVDFARKTKCSPRSNLRSGQALRVFLDETCSRSHHESQGHAQGHAELVGDSREPLGAGLSCLLICPFHSPAPSRPALPPATRCPAHLPTRPHLQPAALHVPGRQLLGRCLRRLQEACPALFPSSFRGFGTRA